MSLSEDNCLTTHQVSLPTQRTLPLRVLQVSATIAPRDGGPPVVALELTRSLARRGHNAKLVTTDSDGASRLTAVEAVREHAADIDIEVRRVHAPRRLKSSLGLWAAIRREIRTRDIVHIHQIYFFSSVVAAWEARRAGVPYVVSPHGTLEPYQRQQGRITKRAWDLTVGRGLMRNAAGYIYTTDSEATGASEVVDPDRAHVVPLGAAVGPGRVAQALVEGPFVLFLGRIAPKKRIDVLIEAFATIADEWTGSLVIAGTGEDGLTAQLRTQAEHLGVTDRIRFVGHVSGASKDWLLRHARAFVLSSENENFAISVAESLAAGTPVIVTRHVALHEVVDRFNAGQIVELDASEVAGALRRLIVDDALHAAQSNGARAAAGAELTWDRTARAAEVAYLQVLGSHA